MNNKLHNLGKDHDYVIIVKDVIHTHALSRAELRLDVGRGMTRTTAIHRLADIDESKVVLSQTYRSVGVVVCFSLFATSAL